MKNLLELILCDLETPAGAGVPVREVIACDATGSFAVRPGHADLVASLVPSIVEWTDASGGKAFAGVPGGILRVSGRGRVEILGRRVYRGRTLDEVAASLGEAMRRDSATAADARRALDQLEAELVSNLIRRKSAFAGSGAPL